MQEPNNYWKGSRYICLVRQSNDADGDDSVKAQLIYLRNECDADGMIYVDKIELEGVTGSLPARREHYTELIARKLKDNDFDTIAIPRIDRATRGGGDFGIWLETELKLSGIRIRFIGEDLPTGRHASLIKMAKYESAKDGGMSTSQRTAQGQEHAIEKGTLKTTGPTPYGAWRIYFTQHGKPSHIIRDCENGLQERLHPETLVIMDTYGTLGKKSYGRYKKQKNEVALLRPGDQNEIRIVRIIFFLWFRWGWKGKRIASLLNKRGVPSPRGLLWSQRQVESVLGNEAYTGITFNNECYSGIYNRRMKGKGFEALNRDEIELLTRETMPRVYVPLEQRHDVDQPWMAEFLPPHIRRMAVAFHEKLALDRLDPMRGKKKRIDQIIDRAILRCQRLASEIRALPALTMRELVPTFFPRVEGDMETKELRCRLLCRDLFWKHGRSLLEFTVRASTMFLHVGASTPVVSSCDVVRITGLGIRSRKGQRAAPSLFVGHFRENCRCARRRSPAPRSLSSV